LHIEILEPTDPGRKEAEQLIHKRYAEIYGANISHYMPHLLRVFSEEGHTMAIVGYRDAAKHPLFLEKYLDIPVEQVLSKALNRPILRSEIVEVGNLADTDTGGARIAIMAMSVYLHKAGFRWVVFTGVARLYNAVLRLGLNPVKLIAADPERLSEQERLEWGSYYDASPWMMGGDISEAYDTLEFDRKVLNTVLDRRQRNAGVPNSLKHERRSS